MSQTWITLRTYESVPLAELAKLQLDDAEIPCRLLNAEVVSMNPLLTTAFGFVPIQVPEEYAVAASEILQSSVPDGVEEIQDDELPSAESEDSADSKQSTPLALSEMRGFSKQCLTLYLGMILFSMFLTFLGTLSLVFGI